MQAILMGADPEVALTRNGKIVPCVGLIHGTKSSPFPVANSAVGLKLQEDNVSLEYNFDPVAVERFSVVNAVAFSELKANVKTLIGKDYGVILADAVEFSEEQLASEQAKAFGCDPDFLAHSRGDMRPPLNPKRVGSTRCFAGHIHIGYDKSKCPTPEWAIVQGIEAFCYMFQVVNGHDQQGLRRALYGLPGLYRPKSYGLEYRTPSNYWIRDGARAQSIGLCAQHIINKPALFQQLYNQVNWKHVQTAILSNGQDVRGTFFDDMSEMQEQLYSAPVEV